MHLDLSKLKYRQLDRNDTVLEDFRSMIPRVRKYTWAEEEQLHRATGLVEKEILEYLKQYLWEFGLHVGLADVHLLKRMGGICDDVFEDLGQEWVMRVSFRDVRLLYLRTTPSFIYSDFAVNSMDVESMSFAGEVDIDAICEGYIFEAFRDRPVQTYLKSILDVLKLAQERAEERGEPYGFREKNPGSIKDEIAKYLSVAAEVPDYAIDPLEFLDEDFTAIAYQSISLDFDSGPDLSMLGI